MIHTSIASSLQAPIKIKQIDIKCSPALGLRLLAKLLYFLGSKWHMKVHCPDCKGVAELADDFSFVKCSNCSFDMTYGEYVKYIAYKDSRYRDILSDYK